MLKEIDLNDPTTKALYDIFPEDKKDLFEDAYVYMKYIDVNIGVLKTTFFPEIEISKETKKRMKDASPELMEHLKKYAAHYIGAFSGGNETSYYNAKVISLKDAIKFVTVDVDVNLEVPKTILPFKLARNIILKGNPSIAIGKCPCRSVMPECKCLPYPYEACMFVGDPIAPFMYTHNPSFRKISKEEAVATLDIFHKMGFSQSAYFKTDMGDGFYAICNCCSCCCAGVMKTNMELDGKLPFSNATASGYLAVIGDDCTGCGTCVEECNYHAIKLNEDETRAEVIFERCMGCGVCEDQCPVEAITMRVEPSKGGILDLDKLLETTESRV
jgi:NAD-dependent dihydropyrimidine dehydrogenase PreA subunit